MPEPPLEPHVFLVAYGDVGDVPAWVDPLDHADAPTGLDPVAAFPDLDAAREFRETVNRGPVDGRRVGVFRIPMPASLPKVEFVYHRVVRIAHNDMITRVSERQEMYIPALRLALPATRVWPDLDTDPTAVDVAVQERPQPNQWRWRITTTGRTLTAVRRASEQEEATCRAMYEKESQ